MAQLWSTEIAHINEQFTRCDDKAPGEIPQNQAAFRAANPPPPIRVPLDSKTMGGAIMSGVFAAIASAAGPKAPLSGLQEHSVEELA